jgi:alpha-ketoglutarate-dependent taurine dioxygenase
MIEGIEPLGQSGALIVHNRSSAGILELPVAEMKELLKTAGVIVFRGFSVDPWRMKAFADRFSSRFNRDRLRPPVEGTGGFVQKLVEGTGYAEPHSEQADSPFRPDALWFCCESPASDGGETLYWDGVKVWEELDPELRDLFTTKKIRYFHLYSSDKWKMFLGHGAVLSDAQRALDGIEGVSYYVTGDESIYIEYVCSALVKTKYGNHTAFTNSLLSERKNTLGDLMSFDDGTPIPEVVIAQIKRTMGGLTEEIYWQPGDLAFIENSRFMHGRNAFSDRRRQMYSCLSFLNF